MSECNDIFSNVETDLIHKGIKTFAATLAASARPRSVEIDLIHKGIKTGCEW